MKNESPITYHSIDMAKVKVFLTDGQTDEQTDKLVLMSPRFRESG